MTSLLCGRGFLLEVVGCVILQGNGCLISYNILYLVCPKKIKCTAKQLKISVSDSIR